MTERGVLLIVTGASRGLGQAIARAFVERTPKIAAVHLIARSSLRETADSLPAVPTFCHSMDLGDMTTLDANLTTLIDSIDDESYDRAVLIHNAGSLGFVGPALDTPSLHEVQQTLDLNLTSFLWMTRRLVSALHRNNNLTIVHISSLTAVQPLPTMALYTAGKAARDSYMQCLALECPSLRVLNYAPGPLQTSMANELLSNPQLDVTLQRQFQNALLDPVDSARVLVDLLEEDTFESGAHIDYFDVVQS